MKTLVKQFLLAFILFGVTFGILIFFHKPVEKNSSKTISPITKSQQTQQNIIGVSSEVSELFIPYWSLPYKKNDVENYSKLIYFGVTPTDSGIDTQDDSYKNISEFLQKTNNQKQNILTVQMLNQPLNETVLQSKVLQDKIISDSIGIAKDNNFQGILLDFELSALGFDSVVKNINAFMQAYANQVHENNLQFYITAYGDTFYRARALDVATLSHYVDGIYVMAYDFHKASGDPGPNFPFYTRVDEDYNFKSMVGDFLKEAPPQKLIFVFGIFGYDWQVSEKGNSVAPGDPISLVTANKKFIQSCSFSNCIVKTDNISKEVEVTYKDDYGNSHDVWLETLDSANVKKEYLSTQGIAKTALWAYSYF